MNAGSEDKRALAGEYVLGTLEASDAASLEAALATDAELAEQVDAWRQTLNLLGLACEPVTPPANVWAGVQAAIEPARHHPAAFRSPYAQPAPRRGVAARVGMALAASIAGVLVASALFFGPRLAEDALYAPPPAYASLLSNTEHQVAWVVSANADQPSQLRVTTMGRSYHAAWSDRQPELWLLAGDNAPRSLGLLPASGDARVTLPDDLAGQLSTSKGGGMKLAVSVEPLGGSPSGAPTGPVVSVAGLNPPG